MIRVAILSKWHVHAVDYAEQAQANPHISIDLIWDEDPDRGEQWANALKVPFEKDLTNVLTNPDIDAVIVTTPTNIHKDVIIRAAQHKKHIFTEKVLAFTAEDCTEIFSAVENTNVELMVSLPRLTADYYLYAQKMVDEGMLGTLNMLRCRVAHNGAVPTLDNPKGWLPNRFFNEEECGGGALIDLGAHPIYLANRLAGIPSAVTGRLESLMNHGVDDHSVALVEYPTGILAVLETSFLSSGSPFQLELYGTEGTLLIENDRIKWKETNQENWSIPEEIPSSLPLPLDQWAEAIVKGSRPTIHNQDAFLLTLVNEAAALSHKEGRRVKLQEISTVSP